MRQQTAPKGLEHARLMATPHLRRQIEAEGRRMDWLADRVGISLTSLSRIVSRERTIAEADARVIAALIGGELGVLFELPESSESALSDIDGG